MNTFATGLSQNIGMKVSPVTLEDILNFLGQEMCRIGKAQMQIVSDGDYKE